MFKHTVLDIVRYLFSSKEKMQILLKKWDPFCNQKCACWDETIHVSCGRDTSRKIQSLKRINMKGHGLQTSGQESNVDITAFGRGWGYIMVGKYAKVCFTE